MSESTKQVSSRRQFLASSGKVAAATTLAGMAVPRVHAGENNTLQVALIGCGGRGTGAAANALSVKQGPVKLVALADVFENRVQSSHANLKNKFGDQVDVPKERQFVGFDAYQKAMDCLKPGDIAIFTSPLTFRWVHFTHAIKKGLHVFMEKPLTADGPTSRRMIDLSKQADAKNLKVGVGLMSRHSRALEQLHQRIQDGAIGDIVTMRGYRMSGAVGSAFSKKWPGSPSELLWQIQRFHSFIWASGGCFNDFYIHIIDHCCWMKNAWPIKAQALGGRHFRGNYVDQNLDTYSVEYTYPDGTKLFYCGRAIAGCHDEFASYAHGTKGSAIISTSSHHPGRVRTFKGHNFDKESLLWGPPEEPNPYQMEWEDLTEAIRQDKPYNEAKRGAEASLVTSMGRMSAHTGQIITFDQILNCEHEMAPDVDKFTMDSPPPVPSDKDGKYPVPMPGVNKNREY